MNFPTTFRFLAAPLMAVVLCASVPPVHATDTQQVYDPADQNKKKKKKELPEGSAGAIALLAAATMGGSLLIWKRKKRAAGNV